MLGRPDVLIMLVSIRDPIFSVPLLVETYYKAKNASQHFLLVSVWIHKILM